MTFNHLGQGAAHKPFVDYHSLEIGESITVEDCLSQTRVQNIRSIVSRYGRKRGKHFSVSVVWGAPSRLTIKRVG